MQKTFFLENQIVVLLLVLLIVIATIFRVYNLDKVPPAFFPDEANIALDAQDILAGNFYLRTPHEGGEGALFAYLLAGAFSLFGSSILVARGVVAAVSVLGVVAVFGLAYRLNGRWGKMPSIWVATLAGIYMAVSTWHVNLSRYAFPQTLGLLVQTLFFVVFWQTLKTSKWRATITAGFLLGLTAYTYVPFKLTPLIPTLFLVVDAVIHRKQAPLWKSHLKLLAVIAGIGGLFYLSLAGVYATVGLRQGTGAFTFLSPMINHGDPWGLLFRQVIANLAGFIPGVNRMFGVPVAHGLDAIALGLFCLGVIIALWHYRYPEFTLLLIWWGVMLIPSIIAPEGAAPHLRRAFGTIIPTAILAGVGLVIPLKTTIQCFPVFRWPIVLTGGIVATISVAILARSTYVDYYLPRLTDPDYAVANHSYDFELADVMTTEGDSATAYILPVDTASGALYPQSSTLAFLYRGTASYAYIWDDQTRVFADVPPLLAGKTRTGIIRWKVSKHTGADPRHLFEYLLLRGGQFDHSVTHRYFDIDYYRINPSAVPQTPASLTPVNIPFGGQITLTGASWATSLPTDAPLWVELGWQTPVPPAADYQVGLWLQDAAGHKVGKVDTPLLSDQLHRFTSGWPAGATERSFHLMAIQPGTPPGDYQLKAVVYSLNAAGHTQRLLPNAQDVGAEMAVTLGDVSLGWPQAAVADFAAPAIALNHDVSPLARLAGVEPLPLTLHPGDRQTLTVWWQVDTGFTGGVSAGLALQTDALSRTIALPQSILSFAETAAPGQTMLKQWLDFTIPADLPSGAYTVALQLPALGQTVPLFPVTIAGRPRVFDVPPMSYAAGVNFADKITLTGYDISVQADKIDLTLVWQAQSELSVPYKQFIHVLDSSGEIITQLDQEPQAGNAPTTGWLPGEVITDPVTLVLPVGALPQKVVVGWYNPADGLRLPVVGALVDTFTLWEAN